MKYVMLIYQGDAQERQAELPEEEQKQVYASSTSSVSTTSATCTRPGPSSCDVSGASTSRVTPFDAQDNSPATAPNGASLNAG